MTNSDVAATLDEIGTLLELKGETPFKTAAYRNAAEALRAVPVPLAGLIAAGRLVDVPGVGPAIRDKVTTLVGTGRLPYLDALRVEVPVGLLEVLKLPGLGTKKVKALHDSLGVTDLATLKAACERGDVAGLKGFGAKTQTRLVEGIAFLATVGRRVRFDKAFPFGLAVLEQVRAFDGVVRAELAGDLRRRVDTADAALIVAAAPDPVAVTGRFVALPEVTDVVSRGPANVRVAAAFAFGGKSVTLPVELRVVPDDQFPQALFAATGSAAHVARLRGFAHDRGVRMNDTFIRTAAGDVPTATEADVYAAVGLTPIPPELREDTGEVEAAADGSLPTLVDVAEIRGVFHNHTTASDGTASLEEMARAARSLGLAYFGVADHSQSLTVARGLSPAAVRKQWAEVDRLNDALSDIRILKGTECDILEDGSLDFPDDLLAGFDYVVASVHSLFQMPEAGMTARVCKALSHPAVTMLGHPTGRLLLKRPAYKIDLDAVLTTAARHGKMIEINAQPSRLDLDDVHVRKAKALGIPIVISPDAHSPGELAYYRYGVNVARRGWLTAADVFNTRSLADVQAELDRRKRAWLT